MSKGNTPFRYDYVGSFLRPEKLKKARQEFEAGKITDKDLKNVEDECILQLVEKQKKAGYHVITDGEFRRKTWHLDFMWGFEGVSHCETFFTSIVFLPSLVDTELISRDCFSKLALAFLEASFISS